MARQQRPLAVLGPADAVGRERNVQSRLVARTDRGPVVVRHRVAPRRVLLRGVNEHRAAVAVTVAGVADEDDVGLLALVREEVELGPLETDAVHGLGIADDALQPALAGAGA